MNELYLWVPTRGWKLVWRGKKELIGHQKQAELYPLETKYFYFGEGQNTKYATRRVSYRGIPHQMMDGFTRDYNVDLETYTAEENQK